jgi:serine/threonine protein kinase/WD40 repeat protein
MAKQREDAEIPTDEYTVRLDQSGTEPKSANFQAESVEKLGGTIGPYKLLDELGSGGMGTVYVADQDRPVRRRVALKVIKPGLDTDQVIARFEAERQALALMDHPNIARVLDAGTTTSGRPYFVMELVQGVPITSYCDSHRVPLRERLELFLPVCRAVQHAHQKGIIHRDLKPSNILVTVRDDEPVAKIIDFGIAKATTQRLTERTLYTQYGQLIGTPDYMSPEQAGMGGLDVDTRSDVYSLGAVLYELVCGDTPLGRHRLTQLDFVAMLNVIYEEEPAPPSRRLTELGDKVADVARRRDSDVQKLAQGLSGELDWIITKALEKERTRRYESPSALAADIERYLNNQPIEAGAPSRIYRLRKFARRNRAPLTAAAAIALVLVAATIVSTWQAFRAIQAQQDMSIERQAALEAKGHAEELLNEVQKSQRLAESRRVDAENAKKVADTQRAEAVKAKNLADESGRQLATALARAEDAAGKEREARSEIERRLREADAMRLAMHAKEMRERYPQRAVLLAAAAVEATRRKNEPVISAADQALRDTLQAIGGRPLYGHSGQVTFMETTPDGRWLLTGDSQSVRQWDLSADDPISLSTVVGAAETNHSARSISADGRWLATVSPPNNSTKVLLWDLKAEKFEAPTREFAITPPQNVTQVVFSPDARWVGARNNISAWIWDLANGAESASPSVLNQTAFTTDFVISANGRWAVVHENSGSLRLWNLTERESPPTLRALATWQGGNVTMRISRDGRWLAASAQYIPKPWLKVWDLNAEDPLASPREIPISDQHLEYCITADSRYFVAASQKEIRLWKLAVDKWEAPQLTLRRSTAADDSGDEPLQTIATDHDGDLLVAADQSGTIFRWDLKVNQPERSGAVVGRHPGATGISMSVSPSGRWLITTRYEDAPRVWDLWGNSKVSGMELRGHDNFPNAVVHARLGGGRSGALATSPQRFDVPFLGMGGRIRASLGLGERWLVTRSVEPIPRLWDLTAANPAQVGLRAGTRTFAGEHVAVRSDGNWIAVKGARQVQLIDPGATDQIPKTFDIPGQLSGWSSTDEPLSRDGRWLAVRLGTRIAIWDLANEQLWRQGPQAIDQPKVPLAAPSSGDAGAVLRAAVEGGKWLQAMNQQNPLFASDGHAPAKVIDTKATRFIDFIMISPNGQWLLTRAENRWQLWNLQDKNSNAAGIDIWEGHDFKNPSFSPDGRWFAGVGQARTPENLFLSRPAVAFWDLNSTPPKRSFLLEQVADDQRGIGFSGDGKWFAAARNGVRLWKVGDDGPAGEPVILNESQTFHEVAVSADGRYIAAASSQTVHLWDRHGPEAAPTHQVLPGHEQMIDGLVFSPDEKWLATASEDGEVRLWNILDDQPQDTMVRLKLGDEGGRGNLKQVLLSPNGQWLAASTYGGIHFWQRDPAQLLNDAYHLAARELTFQELERFRLNVPDFLKGRLLRDAADIARRLEGDSSDMGLRKLRADLLACAGQFDTAIDELRKVIRHNPDDHYPHYQLLALLAQAGRPEEYLRASEEMAERFRDPRPQDTHILERVAKASLFWGASGADWDKLAPLADRALEKMTQARHQYVNYARIVKGLAEYRRGNYESAVQWANLGLTPNLGPTPIPYTISVPGNYVKAMALAQLGRLKEARAALELAKAAHAATRKPYEGWDQYYNDWYMNDLMVREAEALLVAKTPPEIAAVESKSVEPSNQK